jgi:hypothetical protein
MTMDTFVLFAASYDTLGAADIEAAAAGPDQDGP